MKNFNNALTTVQNNTRQRQSTKYLYRKRWDQFAAWCEAEGSECLPPSTHTIGAYLRDMEARGLKASTVEAMFTAITWQVKCFTKVPDKDRPESLQGFTMKDSPMPDAKEIYDTIVSDMEKEEPKRARGITADELAQIFRNDSKPRMYGNRQEPREHARTRIKKNKALFLTMFNGLLRSQEAVNIRWADIEMYPDGSGDLFIRKSKTSGKRRTRNRYLTAETVEALNALKPKGAYDPEDFVFTERQKDGKVEPICGRTITNRIRASAKHAGIQGCDEFSSHSFRVGGAMHLYTGGGSGGAEGVNQKGATLAEIMDAGDWHSSETVLGYIRAGNREQSAVKRLMSGRIGV